MLLARQQQVLQAALAAEPESAVVGPEATQSTMRTSTAKARHEVLLPPHCLNSTSPPLSSDAVAAAAIRTEISSSLYHLALHESGKKKAIERGTSQPASLFTVQYSTIAVEYSRVFTWATCSSGCRTSSCCFFLSLSPLVVCFSSTGTFVGD